MSNFEVPIVRIDSVEDHPNADRLSLNKIGGYIAVSNKREVKDDLVHRYEPGQLVVYVPEGAVVPLDILGQYGYTDSDGKGILAGSKGDRVKAVKLRGVVSQGLIFPLGPNGRLGDWDVKEGQDVSQILGITKYEPVIPASMSGDVIYYPSLTLKFDLENQQKYPDVFQDDEQIYATEKLHGTFCGFVFVDAKHVAEHNINPDDLIPFGDNMFATAFSKGLGCQGLVFKATEENRTRNIYLRALMKLLSDLPATIFITENVNYVGGQMFLLGEVFGKGVQDLDYSLSGPEFAAFNIVASNREYMSAAGFYGDDINPSIVGEFIKTVPMLFRGTYGELMADLETYRDGKSFLDGKTLREGIVVVPAFEGRDDRIGRRALKIVSPDYLLRKNATEYN